MLHILVLGLAGLAACAHSPQYKLLQASHDEMPSWLNKTWEKDGLLWAAGQGVRLPDVESARVQAVKAAAARLAVQMAGKGKGEKEELFRGYTQTLLEKGTVKGLKTERIYQERWLTPQGVEVHTLHVLVSLDPRGRRRQKAPATPEPLSRYFADRAGGPGAMATLTPTATATATPHLIPLPAAARESEGAPTATPEVLYYAP